MADKTLDYRGLKCPQPALKVTILACTIQKGQVVEVKADCPSFPKDIEKWCRDTGRVLISCVESDGHMTATIQF
jgi:tRNA 2-thiouridine synthesizing protein A